MRVLVTGARGFAGSWLQKALTDGGHEVVPAPPRADLDVADGNAVATLLETARPDAVAHLAGVSHAAQAAEDPEIALRTNVGGTVAIVEACRRLDVQPSILVVGSSEVYAPPLDGQPLSEASALGPRTTYGLTKLGAEGAGLWGAALGLRVVIARAFNHTGPGQRPDFVVPAIASRLLAARERHEAWIRVGNIDVSRDIGDVRDTVRAYVHILEAMSSGNRLPDPPVLNVATGRPTPIRDIVEALVRLTGWSVTPQRDESLVRADDPAVIVGSHDRLTEWTGWTPRIGLEQTLRDMLDAIQGDHHAASG